MIVPRAIVLLAATAGVLGALPCSAAAAKPQRLKGGELTTSPLRFHTVPLRHLVVCADRLGKVRWSVRLDGSLDGVRPPHLVWDAERVYVTHQDGITALDASTGKVRWHVKGPQDRLFLSRGLLLATECSSGDEVIQNGRWLTARRAADGKEVFKVRLPVSNFDPWPIEKVAGLFLIQTSGGFGGKDQSWLIDQKGVVRHRLERQVLDGRRRNKDVVLLTDRDVVRLAPDGRPRWQLSFREEWLAGGGLQEVDGGDLVAFVYGQIRDSGVWVIRLNPATGKAVWRARCAPLGVGHSKYHHQATIRIKGDRAEVTSQGSAGTFVELLDLESGRRVKRTRK
jgi:outer membrane protein assembly factor BamB